MNNQSPIETLRQLREMLDAGTITQAEFDQLKQQLIFAAQAPAVPAADSPAPTIPEPAAAPLTPTGQHSPMFEDAQLPPGSIDLDAAQTQEVLEVPTRPLGNEATAAEVDNIQAPPARNPLNLVLAIGGLLVLLSVCAYLAFNQRDSEHISSSTMTAADSVSVVEEGPQAAPVEQPVALPETVRVAPTNPAPPVVKPSVAPAAPDSTAATPAAVDSTKKP